MNIGNTTASVRLPAGSIQGNFLDGLVFQDVYYETPRVVISERKRCGGEGEQHLSLSTLIFTCASMYLWRKEVAELRV